MQFDNRIIAAIMALAFIAGAFSMISSDIDADQEYTRDYGQFYSYTLQFVFDGSEAQTIDWDFGDGSAHSEEWNPRHTYSNVGTYYVTQTTTNTKGTTTEIYKVQIMGFPKITFNSNGGSSVADIQMDSYNAVASKPSDPTRSGYTFDGWFYDQTFDNAVDWSSGITRSMTFYAKWTAVETPVVNYTVTFDSNGGSSVSAQTVASGSTAVAPSEPSRSGYTFVGWYLGDSKFNFGTAITSNITLIAHWTEVAAPVTNYTVSFDVNGGSVSIDSQSILSGSTFTIPSYTGTKAGYDFGGWSFNNVTYQPGQSITVNSDISFKAVWRSTDPIAGPVTVSFNVDGGSVSIDSKSILPGSTFTFPSYEGKKEGCVFGGWVCGLKVYQPGQSVEISGDITVKAIWNAESEGNDKDIIDESEEFIKDFWWIILLIILLLLAIVVAVHYHHRRRF